MMHSQSHHNQHQQRQTRRNNQRDISAVSNRPQNLNHPRSYSTHSAVKLSNSNKPNQDNRRQYKPSNRQDHKRASTSQSSIPNTNIYSQVPLDG